MVINRKTSSLIVPAQRGRVDFKISEKCSAPSGLPGPAAVEHGASKLASRRGEPLLPPPAAQEIPHLPKAALEGRGAGRTGARQGPVFKAKPRDYIARSRDQTPKRKLGFPA
ncbi:unnamed protein product [Rangifer tarandus platyrhynchus]|uniref:Uncharacterized protein n=2 Tax=Rangifer tarandus platyrhynchus TaxID=3082113 RepID=A0ABN8ZI37_RANTA|nr:unnamed protein product [Rangifer tarandus platyrhynchus]CAI9708923.1 unnamed protein product [Rangifer tarandus platyrhynchus]